MTSVASRCPQCSEPASDRDDWCAICGVVLRGLDVTPARLLVTDHSMRSEVELRATGVLPTTFALPRGELFGAPSWVTPHVVPDVATTLSPGEVMTVDLLFTPRFLPSGRGDGEESGHFSLKFVTASLACDEEGNALRQTATLELLSPSRARIRPAFAQTRLLPRQLIEDGRLVAREVELHNAGGHVTRLVRVTARDFGLSVAESDRIARGDPSLSGPLAHAAATRVLARDLVTCPPLSASHTIDAGGRTTHGFALRLAEGALAPGEVRTFDVEIVFVLEDPIAPSSKGGPTTTSTREVSARLVGHVGAAPDVILVDTAPAPIRTHGARTMLEVSIRNPGAAPVVIDSVDISPLGVDADTKGVDVSRPSSTPAATARGSADWLRLPSDVAGGFTLDAGETQTLQFLIEPDQRQGAALQHAWGERKVSLRHDGWQPDEGDRSLSFRVSAELGEVVPLQGAVVGIDFGTSSSAVSLLHGESGRAFALPLEPELDRDELPSVLFYRGSDPPFLFGTEAENAAPLSFSNVVRSIKSVVARDPDLTWAFLERTRDDDGSSASQLRVFRSAELLARFLVEMKRRAEQGVRQLPHDFLDALDLSGRGVRLSRAVFTHPVDTASEALEALHTAAVAADLCPAEMDLATFSTECCLDEALAAVLAFVFVLAGGDGGAAAPLRELDDFTLLSVDVGGGTSDLASVRVKNLASFLRGSADTVEVELGASGGESRLGGDDFDRVLAHHLLNKLADTPEGAACDLDGVGRAITHPSYESFRRSGARGQDDHARGLWSAASSLLRKCEEKKRTLSSDGQVQVLVDVTDWPGASSSVPGRRQVEFSLTRKEAAGVYAPLLGRLSSSTTRLLADAGVDASAVSAVLFTGKGSRLPEVSEAVLDAVSGSIPAGIDPPLALLPGSIPGFDEKRCVAMGAAVWGDSRGHGGGWLVVTHRAGSELDASFALRRGPRFVDVEGLKAGAQLPARGVVRLGTPSQTVVLYRQGRAAFAFSLPAPAAEVVVVVEGRDVAFVEIGGERIRGTVQS